MIHPLIPVEKLSQSDAARLELLSYPNPEGLHPVEAAWRDFARNALRASAEEATAMASVMRDLLEFATEQVARDLHDGTADPSLAIKRAEALLARFPTPEPLNIQPV